MRDSDFSPASGSPGNGPPSRGGYRFSRWKIVLCAGAALMVVAGLMIEFSGGSEAPETPEAAPREAEAPRFEPALPGDPFVPKNSFLPGEPGFPNSASPRPDPEPAAHGAGEDGKGEGRWSAPLVQGGAGFLVGFVVGLALRTVLRAALVMVGLVLLALIGFSHAGWIDVRWEMVQDQVNQLLGRDLADVKAFLLGSLPSAGLAGLGLFAGFKKK